MVLIKTFKRDIENEKVTFGCWNLENRWCAVVNNSYKTKKENLVAYEIFIY